MTMRWGKIVLERSKSKTAICRNCYETIKDEWRIKVATYEQNFYYHVDCVLKEIDEDLSNVHLKIYGGQNERNQTN